MKAPAFWYKKRSLQSLALAPLGWLYAFGTARRLAKGIGYRCAVPVICIGNINAGGTGKTPTVIALMQRLSARGITAHVVTRGYGGRFKGPLHVDPVAHSAGDVGDEPLLMAAFGTVWMSKDRAQGAKRAETAGAQVILLDDGLQNPELIKDLSLVVVDGGQGFGNGRCLPAGPLREPIPVGLKRADFVLQVGAGKIDPRGVTHLKGTLEPLQTGMRWEGLPVFAFAGIGNPLKFFKTLKSLGVDLRGTASLADHQELSPALLKRMGERAAALGAQPVTTEKDAVRLPPELRGKVLTLPVRLELEDWRALDHAIDALL